MSNPRVMNVLIAEDDPVSAMVLRKALENRGYSVTLATDGGKAWDLFQRAPYSLVISDWMMPVMDGVDLCRRIRACDQQQYTYFILLTAKSQSEERSEGFSAGVDDYLVKPLDPIDLDSRLRVARRILSMQEELYRLALVARKTNSGVVITDAEGRVDWINQAFTHMCGYSLEELRGKKPGDTLQCTETDAETIEQMRAGIESKEGFSVEIVNRHKDGHTYWAAVECTPILDDKGGISQLIAIESDVSERRRQQDELRRQFERITALKAIDIAVNYSRDLGITLAILLEQIPAHLGIDAAAVLGLDPKTKIFKYSAGRGFLTDHITRRQVGCANLDSDLDVWGQGKADNAGRTPAVVDGDEELMAAESFKFHEVVPLQARGDVVGLLEIYHRSPIELEADQFEFLATISGQAAIAIENSLLLTGLKQSHDELAQAYDATIEGWSRALDLRDNETDGHSQRVTQLCVQLAGRMGFTEEQLVHLRRGSLLHDIGKMGVPDHILLKPGPLSDTEWDEMRKHPAYAFDMLRPIQFLKPALDIPYCHHEKWDGTGYPRNLGGTDIPLAARIFAVIDVWDALRSNRPYRIAWSRERARDYIVSLSGSHFDPDVVENFVKMLEESDIEREPESLLAA